MRKREDEEMTGDEQMRRGSLDDRKRIAAIAVACLAAAAVLFAAVPAAYAAVTSEDLAAELYAYSVSQMQTVKDILLGSDSGFQEAILGEDGLGSLVSDAITGLACVWATALCIKEVFTELMRGDPEKETWLRIATKLIVTLFLVVNCSAVFDALRDVGNVLVEYIADSAVLVDIVEIEAEYGTSDIATMLAKLQIAFSGGFLNSWLSMLGKLISYAFLVEDLIIKSMSYVLFMEFAVRRAFAPIIICDISGEGLGSPGIRYLKKFLGVYIKMAILILCVYCSWALIYAGVLGSVSISEAPTGLSWIGAIFSTIWDIISTSFSLLVSVFCIQAAAIAAARTGGRLVNEVID